MEKAENTGVSWTQNRNRLPKLLKHIAYQGDYITDAKTAVGDKYVYEYMAKNGCRIGGEQSGHIIFSKYASTGDGNGTVVGEQYFDTDGNPVRSSLGQYGELYQRNEQGYIGQITYLGADGKTTPTNAGYTKNQPELVECLQSFVL